MIAQADTCDPEVDILCEPDTPPEDPPDGSVIGDIVDAIGDAVEVADDVAETVVDEATDLVVDNTVGVAGDLIGGFAQEAAEASIEALTDELNTEAEASFAQLELQVQETTGTFDSWIDAAPLIPEIRGTAGYIVLIGFVLALGAIMFRRGRVIVDFGGRFIAFLIVFFYGSALVLGGMAISDQIMAWSIATDFSSVNLEEAGLVGSLTSVFIVPVVIAVLKLRGFIMWALLGLWIAAAALSTIGWFKRAQPIMLMLIAANLLWPVVLVMMVSEGLQQFPDVMLASLIIGLSATTPFIANGLAIVFADRG